MFVHFGSMKAEDRLVKYLPVGAKDIDWGFYVTTAGFTRIPPHTPYPPGQHPADHHFTWEQGRVLSNTKLSISRGGKGTYKTEGKKAISIREGTVILLFPNTRHRYQPDPTTGWDEYWIGFNGTYAQHLVEKKFFSHQRPVLFVGQDEHLLRLYQQLFDRVREEEVAFQQVISAIAVQMLASVYALTQRKGLNRKRKNSSKK